MRKPVVPLLCAILCVTALPAAPAAASDGADSPESIAKFTKAMLGKLPCALQSGEVKLEGKCVIKASGQKSPDGIATYALTGNPGQVTLSGTILPSLEGGTFVGERLCNGKDKPFVTYQGELKRTGKKAWQGQLLPDKRSPLCGPVTLLLGK